MNNVRKIVSILLSFAILLSSVAFCFLVSAETTTNYIVNGDFEEGQKGFLNAEDAGMNVKVYDNADTTRPGYGEVNLNGKAAYLPSMSVTDKRNLLQYKIENLPAGEYTISMDALVGVKDAGVWAALGFGITDTIYSVAGVAYGNNMISNTAKATKNGSAITVNSTAVYHRLAGSTLTAGWHDVDVELTFEITETKTLYLFMFAGANNQTNAYIDNVKIGEGQEESNFAGFVNGDFEEGQKGFLNAEDAGMNIKVYDNADTTRPGYGEVNLDGKAAYLPSMSVTDKRNLLQYKIENLPAGKYTISMDALVGVKNAGVWAALGFGITDTIYSSGVAYGNNMISNTAKATKNGSAVTVNSTAVYHRLAGSTLTVGWHNVDVELTFETTETKTLYLFMFAGANNQANAYIDNILFKKTSDDEIIVNGDFERGQNGYLYANDSSMKVKVYNDSDTTRPGYGKITLDGKAAYLPGGKPNETNKFDFLQYKINNLPAGKYTLNFNSKINLIDPEAWTALGFGITETIGSNGVAYASGNMLNTTGSQTDSNFNNHTVKATRDKTDIPVNSINRYHRISGSSLYPGWNDLSIEIAFETDETKTLYLFIFAPNFYHSTAYIDNIELTKSGEAEESYFNGFVNGDFEEGQKGYMYAGDTDMSIKVYDSDDATRPGYGKVTLDGKAAYILGSEPNETNKSDFLQYKINKLPAGKYTLGFNAQINVIDSATWTALGFGITETIGSNGVAYASGNMLNTTGSQTDSNFNNHSVKVVQDEIDIPINSINRYHRIAGSVLSVGWNDLSIKIDFEITETKTLYLFIFTGDRNKSNAYIDNITLGENKAGEESYFDKFVNGDFEEGQKGYLYANNQNMNVKVYDNADTKRPGYGEVSLNGKAAYVPHGKPNQTNKFDLLQYKIENLPAGNYTISADAMINVIDPKGFTGLGFGITETIKGGVSYSSGNMINTTGLQTDSNFGNHYARVTQNGKKVIVNSINRYHRIACTALPNKWNECHIEITFETTQLKTLYLFMFTGADESVAYIDNINLKKIEGDFPAEPVAKYDYENTIYHITFEENDSYPIYKNGGHYIKTDKFAHTGKYSIEWDAYHDDGWENIYFTDKVGNPANNPLLKPNTVYRFSAWVYAVGKGSSNTKVAWNSPVQARQQSQHLTSANQDWEQFIFTFSTGPDMTSCPIEFCVGISGLLYEGLKVYVDDIKLEKLVPSVLYTENEENYCEDIVNQIDNGNFEKTIKGSIWDSKDINIKLVKETKEALAPSGLYYAHIVGNSSLKVKLNIKSGYEYKFIYSYKTNKKSDFKIGILDDNGNELQPENGSDIKHTSLIVPKQDGEWHREGYTFFTPASGYIYFYLLGVNSDIYLDAISLYKARLSSKTDPNTYINDITLEDLDIGLDNTNFEGITLSEEMIDDINSIDQHDEISSSVGRYKKIRRIYTTSWWVYALIIAGCVVAVGGVSVLVIVLVKKKHRKIIK